MSSLLKQLQDTLPDYIHTLPEKDKPAIWLPREKALQHERIRLHGNDRHFLIVDYDVKNENEVKDHNHYDLEPNFITYNYDNPNHQAFFRIKDPVHAQKSSRFNKPYLYLKAIERAFDEKYDGDKHFARYISRNPLHAFADTDWRHDRKYSLNQLAEVVNLNVKRIKTGTRKVQGIGRNREVFDDLRFWAYKQDTSNITYQTWLNKVLIKAIGYNTYTNPMDLSEVESIAKSVSQYTYQKSFNHGDYAAFCARQAERGRKGGLVSKGGGRPSLGEPWINLNISRATYFRHKKLGLL
jgi:hypothetical protein